MHTIRALAIGLAILTLLAGTALGAVAQSPSAVSAGSSSDPVLAADQTVWVTGKMSFGGFPTGGTEVATADGVTQSRGWSVVNWPVLMSDARLSGSWSITDGSSDAFDTPEQLGLNWGSVRVENKDGAWAGERSGVSSPDGSWMDIMWLVGEGAYAGLSSYLRVTWVPATSDFHGDAEGLIFPGNPPPQR